MLDDNDGVSLGDEAVKCLQQRLDVVEVQAGGGLVEDEHRGLGVGAAEEAGQLDALVLAAGECRGRLTQADISQADLGEGFKPLGGTAGGGIVLIGGEESDGIVDGHVKDVVDVFAAIGHLQHLGLEALAVAGLALDGDVAHELHLYGDCALALALVAASAIGVEREVGWGEAHLPRQLRVGEELAYLVVGLDVCGGIGAR